MDSYFQEQLKKWVEEGCRAVDIKYSTHDGPFKVKIWCFDYQDMEGKYITSVDQIPVEGEFKLKKIEQAKRVLREVHDGPLTQKHINSTKE